MTLDWLDPSRAQFLRLSANLPHALLIHGEIGVGKNVLVMEIIASLLCDHPEQEKNALQACGQCKSCVLFRSNSHPDFHYLASEWWVRHADSPHLIYAERYLEDQSKRQKRKPRQIIAVDQIRTLIDDFSLSHHSAEHKVALIQPAEAMNTNAANALLKLLEEPNPDSILILVSSDISALPMTIRSRCIAITVNKPSPDRVISWLQAQQVDDETASKALALSAGAPFTALSYSQSEDIQNFENVLSVLSQVLHQQLDPIRAREALIKSVAPKVLLSWLQIIISWLVELTSMSTEEQQMASWQAYGQELSNIIQGFERSRVPQLFRLYEDLLQIKRQDVDIINLSLAIDKWLIAFAQRLVAIRA